MEKFELKSLNDTSMLRKFSVLFLFSSVFPLVILTVVYFIFLNGEREMDIDLFFKAIFFAAIFGFIGFMYMRQSLKNINKISVEFKNALKDDLPKEIDIGVKGNNEVALIAESFNLLVKKLENSVAELDSSKHMLIQAIDREQILSRTDSLTGIANRRVFYEMAEMEINKFRRYGHPFSVLLIDIDKFKNVNDSYGHQKGDSVLCVVANMIKESIRLTDIVARVGGDEFTVLLAEIGIESLATTVLRLQSKLVDTARVNGWPITFSIGVVTFNIVPKNVDEIMKEADVLMYTAKHAGKNNINYGTIN